jgi:hypothetical protein
LHSHASGVFLCALADRRPFAWGFNRFGSVDENKLILSFLRRISVAKNSLNRMLAETAASTANCSIVIKINTICSRYVILAFIALFPFPTR